MLCSMESPLCPLMWNNLLLTVDVAPVNALLLHGFTLLLMVAVGSCELLVTLPLLLLTDSPVTILMSSMLNEQPALLDTLVSVRDL